MPRATETPLRVAAQLLHEALVRIQSFQLRSAFYLQITEKKSGPDETRTRDLCHAKAALSQLSYGPKIKPGYSTVSVLNFRSIATAKRRYEVYHAAFARFKCA